MRASAMMHLGLVMSKNSNNTVKVGYCSEGFWRGSDSGSIFQISNNKL